MTTNIPWELQDGNKAYAEKLNDNFSAVATGLNQVETDITDVTNWKSQLTVDPAELNLLSGMTGIATQTMGNSSTVIPTEAAVQTAMVAAGLGDMMKSVYDPNNTGIVKAAAMLEDTAGNKGWPVLTANPSQTEGQAGQLALYNGNLYACLGGTNWILLLRGVGALTANGLLVGNADGSAAASLAPPAEDSLLTQGPGAAPAWATMASLIEDNGILSSSTFGLPNAASGSYVGNGNTDNPVTLSFPFTPKFVFVMGAAVNGGFMAFTWGAPSTSMFYGNGVKYIDFITYDGNAVSYRSNSGTSDVRPIASMNQADVTYNYFALG